MENNQLTVAQQVDSAIQQMNLPTCLQIYSPNNLFETFCDVATVEQALATKAPSMLQLSKTDGCTRKQVFGLLQLHLMLLSHNSKVKQGLSKMEVDMLASDIMRDFFFLTFADINVVFKRFYHGEYGQLYGSLSVSDVYQWFSRYANERCDTAAEQSRIADEKRYHSDFTVPDDFSLEQLGYVKDEETGAWRIDTERVAQREAERKEREAREAQRKAEQKVAKLRENEELARIRREVAIKNILAKPLDERTDAECDYLMLYDEQTRREEEQKATVGEISEAQ